MLMLMRRPSNHTTKGPGREDRKGLTIIELLRKFPDDATAERWFEELRWKHRPTCPDCHSGNHGHCPSHPSMPYTCKDCRKRFSVRKGTIMQSSNLGYQAWAVAFYMAATNLKGISSMKLHRELGITQKTAWHMLQRIREVFRDGEAPLSGIVRARRGLPRRQGAQQARIEETQGRSRNRPGRPETRVLRINLPVQQAARRMFAYGLPRKQRNEDGGAER